MKKKIMSIMLTAAIAGTVLAGCGEKKATVTTDGSTSMEKVIGALGESFSADNKNITVTYNPNGSSSGIKAVAAGT